MPTSPLPLSSEKLPVQSSEEAPFVFQKPTLGQAVQLGELYNARTASFLGVQMYDQNTMNGAIAITDNRYSDLSLSMANSFQDKASVIDLSAELSVEVLGGLIKVSGSAAYLHDSKSNTQERSWVLSYKARLMEKRLCFSEEGLGLDVLPLVMENYINTNAATHFVSSITYGGNVFARMTVKESKLEEQDKIEGKLQASFEGLKAALNVSGSVSAKIDTQLQELNDKFDVQVYGDVALDQVPLNPEDVTVTFSKAAEALIKREGADHGGVPISVTLQPIPPNLFVKANLIHRVNQDLLSHYLKEYARLEDIASRFAVLEEFAKTCKDVVPEFATNKVQPAVEIFRDKYRERLEELGQMFRDLLDGGSPNSESLLSKARQLYEHHTQVTSTPDPDLGEPLKNLEPFYFKFRDFVTGVNQVGFRLKSVNEVSLAARRGSTIPLILMPPIDVDDLTITGKLIQLSFLLRVKAQLHFSDTPDSCYLLYVEDKEKWETWLPQDATVFEDPSMYCGRVSDIDGTLVWTMLWPTLQPAADIYPYISTYGDMWRGVTFSRFLTKLEPRQSYTLMTRARFHDFDAGHTLLVQYASADIDGPGVALLYVTASRSVEVEVMDGSQTGYQTMTSPDGVVPKQLDIDTWFTLVQDTKKNRFYLYVNDKMVASLDIPDNFVFHDTLAMYYDDSAESNYMWADLEAIVVYPSALSEDMISSVIKNYKPPPEAVSQRSKSSGRERPKALARRKTAPKLPAVSVEGSDGPGVVEDK